MDLCERWAEWNGQRGRVPEWHPVGVVIDAQGLVVRRHYGTHGTVEYSPLVPGTDIAGLVRVQQEAFAERGEPVEWKVYGHDSPGLDRALTAAGFTAGWERSVLIVGPLPDEERDTPPAVASDRSADPPRREARDLYGCEIRPSGRGRSPPGPRGPTRCPTRR